MAPFEIHFNEEQFEDVKIHRFKVFKLAVW